jgi:IS5 family transposase
MGQFGFFDARRLAAITAKGDPLEMIARVVPFESLRAEIETAVLTPVSEKKSSAGRKPIDVMVIFRMLVLQFALQSVGRTGGVSSARPAVVHAVSGAWH